MVKYLLLDIRISTYCLIFNHYIKRAAIYTRGAVRPSEVDAYVWWWMCTSFRDHLYDTIASVVHCLSTGAVYSAVHVDAFYCLSTDSTGQVLGHSPHWNWPSN